MFHKSRIVSLSQKLPKTTIHTHIFHIKTDLSSVNAKHPALLKPMHSLSLEVLCVYLEQMTSWEVRAAGSSFSRLLDRSIVCSCRRPQGTTEGRAVRQLDDRSRCVIRDDRSMNQSSSNQGSCRSLHNTLTACTRMDVKNNHQQFFTEVLPFHKKTQWKNKMNFRFSALTSSSSPLEELSSTLCRRRFLQKAGWSIRV